MLAGEPIAATGSSSGSSGSSNSDSGSSDSGNSSNSDNSSNTPVAHTHNYIAKTTKEATCTQDGEQTWTCSCGAFYTTVIKAIGHAYVATEDSKDATCLDSGYQTYQCTACGKTYKEEIAALGHDGKWTVETAATHTSEGLEILYCVRCREVLENRILDKLAEHSFAIEIDRQEASCTEDGFVLRECECGETEKEIIKATGHTSGEWIVDVAPTCTDTGSKHTECEVCGEIIETVVIEAVGHIAGDWEIIAEPTYTDQGEQIKKCTICGLVLETETIEKIFHDHNFVTNSKVDATCTSEGYESQSCTLCGETKRITIPATGHTEAWIVTKTPTCTEIGIKQLVCEKCGNVADTTEIEATGHTPGEWVIDIDPTCTDTGSKHKECTVCGETVETTVIVATGHSYGEWMTTLEPTCTETGEQEKICAVCGDTIKSSLDARGHQYGDWIISKEATEDAQGEKYKECEVCGDKVTEEIEQLTPHTHDYQRTASKEATCSAKGSITYTCSICNDSYEEEIPMKEHTLSEWTIKIPATEDTEGMEVQNCTVCGAEVNTRVIEKLEHVHSYTSIRTEPTCTENGKIVYTCSKCGDSYEETLAATGHSYVTETKAATCTETGYTKTTCKNCDYENIETIAMLEHTYEETERVEPTCIKDGSVAYKCSVCGDSYTEILASAGQHTPGDWIVTKEPELGVDGEKTQSCTECGEVLATEKIDMLLTDGTDSVYWIDIGNGEKELVIGHLDEEAASKVLTYVNNLRTEVGAGALAIGEGLQASANLRGAEIAYFFDHTRPNGEKWSSYVKSLSSDWSDIAENIAYGQSTAAEVYLAWKNSSGHYANMINPNYNYIGISCFCKKTDTGYVKYWVQNFGDIPF